MPLALGELLRLFAVPHQIYGSMEASTLVHCTFHQLVQETYGLPRGRGARSPRGDKRKWEGPPQPADEDETKVHKVDSSSVTAGEGNVHAIPNRRETRDFTASLDAEWSD